MYPSKAQRAEVQEYNVARNLRQFDENDFRNYVLSVAKHRVFMDNSLNRNGRTKISSVTFRRLGFHSSG